MNIEKVKDHIPLLTHPAAKLTKRPRNSEPDSPSGELRWQPVGIPLLVGQSLRYSCSKTERVGEEPVTGWGGGEGQVSLRQPVGNRHTYLGAVLKD